MDRVGVEVDELDVGFVDDFVEVLFEGGAFGSPGVRFFLWGEDFLFFGVGHALQDGFAPEIVGFVVGGVVEEHVVVGVEPVFETAFLDELFVVESFALFGGVVKGVFANEIVGEAGEGGARVLDGFFVGSVFFLALFFFGVESSLVHG